MAILPGLLLALILAFAGQFLSHQIGVTWLGLPKSPISAIMMAILLGMLIRNTVGVSDSLKPGIDFGLKRVLRLGIVLLGIRLSLGEVGTIGLQALPVIIGVVTAAILLVTTLARRVGLTGRFGTLIAVGTSICGATAIVAIAPAIAAKDNEVTYGVAFVTIFGVLAMLAYPFAAEWMFAGDSLKSGLFLGTSVHETAQVAGAGLVYQQYYNDPAALDIATVTKLVRNMGMLVVIPVMSIIYHRRFTDAPEPPKWYTLIPLFVVGFACMSLVRTVGDMGDMAFGFIDPAVWNTIVTWTRDVAEICLAVAMAAVGLGTSIRALISIGLKPLGVGLFSAFLVGGVSAALIAVLY